MEQLKLYIDGAHLDPDAICPETGMVDCGAYGKDIKGRSKEELSPLKGDWRRLLEATEAVGYTETIPVYAGMVDYRPAELPVMSVDSIIAEMDSGFPRQRKTIHLLHEINHELTPAMAA